MIQRYNGNIERSKLQVTQPGILKIYACFRKLQERASVTESALVELQNICL